MQSYISDDYCKNGGNNEQEVTTLSQPVEKSPNRRLQISHEDKNCVFITSGILMVI